MTVERLTVIAALCMAITGFVVYTLTSPPAAQPSVAAAANTLASVATSPASQPSAATRSDPPTVQEWGAAEPVEIAGSTGLNCVAKVHRDWLRVACEGTNDTGGRPKDVRILDAKLLRTDVGSTGIAHAAWSTPRGAAYTASSTSITSLVCPFVEGVNLEAQFDWTDKRAALRVSWPTGSTEPRTKARFRPL